MSKNLNDVYDDLLILIYSKFLDIVKTLRVEKARGMRIIKIRIIFKDESFLDVIWGSSGKYSLHWERRHINGTIYRYDNAPHWKNISTFPNHFHDGSEKKVTPSYLPKDPLEALKRILEFIRSKILKKRTQ